MLREYYVEVYLSKYGDCVFSYYVCIIRHLISYEWSFFPIWVYYEVMSCEDIKVEGCVRVACKYEFVYTLTKNR